MRLSIMVAVSLLLGTAFCLDSNVIKAIAIKESSNRTGVVGDLQMKTHSYGKYQIRQCYIDDVMSKYGKEYKRVFGNKKPTLKEIQWNDKMGLWFVEKYIGYYGAAYTKETGKKITPEVAFMIHNGGPKGWKKGSLVYQNASLYASMTMKIYRGIS